MAVDPEYTPMQVRCLLAGARAAAETATQERDQALLRLSQIATLLMEVAQTSDELQELRPRCAACGDPATWVRRAWLKQVGESAEAPSSAKAAWHCAKHKTSLHEKDPVQSKLGHIFSLLKQVPRMEGG